MNYGRFFRLNNEKSDLSRGIAFYDYIWIEDEGNGENGTPKYPVYLTISHNSIDFRAHYHEDSNTNGKHISKHLHNIILSLPLSANLDVKDGLTEALVKGWLTNFPQHEDGGSNYLHGKLKDAILNDKNNGLCYTDLTVFNKNQNISIIQEAKNFLLFCKDGCTNSKDNQCPNVHEYCQKCNESCKHLKAYTFQKFIRILILDFLFDLEQTKVFETSPHYEHISIKLKENFFFNALAAKANFYYLRKIITEKVKPVIDKLDKINNQILALYPYDGHNYTNEDIENKLKEREQEENELAKLSIYVEYYLKAKMQWEKAIRSPKSEENFNGYEDEWFRDPEIEMRNVYNGLKGVKTTGSLEETRKRNEKKSKYWRIAHYDIFTDKYIMSKYLLIPRVLISIAAAWFTFILGSNLWGDISTKINPTCWVVGLFCSGLCFVSFRWLIYLRTKPKINLSYKKKGMWCIILRGAFYMTALGFVYSAVIGAILRIFVSHTKESCGQLQYCHCCQWQYWFGEKAHFYWVAVCLAVFIGVVIQSFMDEKTPADEL